MLKEYLGVDLDKYGLFFVAVIATSVIITGIYWAIFGFDRWAGQVQTAADLMTAAAVSPFVQSPAVSGGTGQYVCPQDGAVGLPNFDMAGVPHCPLCGQAMNFYSAASNNFSRVAAGGG
ncbi:MAG TPA: hypothetical protein VMW78_01915 [Anaerolineae bacterium]|nr:hypothetical protein [Anaerolineae bacterium]